MPLPYLLNRFISAARLGCVFYSVSLRESLQRNPNVLEVDLEDLNSKEEGVCQTLRSNPADVLPLVRST